MSTLGKRVIWVGPADGANHNPRTVEGVALAATAPGTVLKAGATGLAANDNAATVFGVPFIVADKDQMRSRSVDDAWTINENMVAIAPRDDEFVNVLVATGQALVANVTPLTSNGAGLLTIAATDGTVQVYATAAETVTTTATQLVRVKKA